MNVRVASLLSMILSLLILLPLSSTQNVDRTYDTVHNPSDRYVATANGPPGHSKWNGRGSSRPPGHNKWEGDGRGPPGGHGPPGLAGGSPPGLNKRPPGWNEENVERPSEDEKYIDNQESTYKPRPTGSETGPYGPDDRISDSNKNSQNQRCRKDEFHCKSNECLPQNVRCDKRIDCRDASDEAFCIIDRFGESGCVLPEQPENGNYILDGCNSCTKRPGDIIPLKSILTYNCKSNYLLSGNTISVCVANEWSEPPSCYKVCPPLNSTSVDISCSYKEQTVSCSERILPGTRATLACKSSYKLPLTNDPAYREITCLDDGLWDRRLFRCLPECGTSTARGNTLIVNGFEAKVGKFPWHVGIYSKKLHTDEYEQICGGTLISSYLVVSAAHCVYDEVNNKLYNARNYAVAAGKHYRDWNAREKYAQKSSVESIRLGGRYMGARGNFADDVALLKLKTPFELTTLVKPVCMDWNNEYEREQLQVGQVGKVVGWGKDIRGESTRNLQEIDMPFVPYQQCLSAVPVDFRGYLTSDKFCAGRLNEICPPLRSTSVDISCSRKGETVSCNKFVLPGTQATFACKPSYKLPVTNDYREITCLDDGTWDNHIFRGLPECGTSIARGQTLIVNGYEAKVGFPWHVGIYTKQQSDNYKQICGGTLISSNLVLSGVILITSLEPANFRNWDARDEYAQKSLVESIRTGERI